MRDWGVDGVAWVKLTMHDVLERGSGQVAGDDHDMTQFQLRSRKTPDSARLTKTRNFPALIQTHNKTEPHRNYTTPKNKPINV